MYVHVCAVKVGLVVTPIANSQHATVLLYYADKHTIVCMHLNSYTQDVDVTCNAMSYCIDLLYFTLILLVTF
jgi:hypothetical protein